MKKLFAIGILMVSCLFLSDIVNAQTPPSTYEQAQYSIFHKAVFDGDLLKVKRLINEGADLEERDDAGRTAVHLAAFASNEELLTALVDAGADINALENDRYDVITIAAVENDTEMLQVALSLGAKPDNITSPYDGTALIAAAHLGHYETVLLLIEAGAPLDHVNNLGWTALIESIVLGDGGDRHVRTARALIDAGADVSIADRSGVTPLAHAKQRGYQEMVILFAN
jgi:uncharacterized protein